MLHLLFGIAILGLLTYLIVTYIPMPAAFKNVIIVVAIICLIIIVMNAFGIVDMPVPRLR